MYWRNQWQTVFISFAGPDCEAYIDSGLGAEEATQQC